MVAALVAPLASVAALSEHTFQSVQLRGSHMTPNVTTDASGKLQIDFDASKERLEYELRLKDVDNIRSVQFFCMGSGTTTPAFHTLFTRNGSDIDDETWTGSFGSRDFATTSVSCVPAISNLDAFKSAVGEGRISVRVLTDEYPAGIIQGNLTLNQSHNQNNHGTTTSPHHDNNTGTSTDPMNDRHPRRDQATSELIRQLRDAIAELTRTLHQLLTTTARTNQ